MIKRLSGGLILLCLTSISLGVTSGEVSISDPDVLEQLKELRTFIDVNRDFSKGFKNLKPVLVEYRSSASKFNGIALGNLSFNTDALHMSIGINTIQADGKMLIVTINVVYEWEDFIGYKVKSAKLTAYETLATGDGTFTGDVGVGGDLEVTGDVTIGGDIIGDIEVDGQIVEKMTGYTWTTSNSDKWTPIYVGAVKNGNKLTCVIFGRITIPEGGISATGYGYFTIPKAVGNKLIPYEVGSAEFLSNDLIGYVDENSYNTIIQAIMDVQKDTSPQDSDVLYFNLRDPLSLVAEHTYLFRYEVTFLLSDNLVSNE